MTDWLTDWQIDGQLDRQMRLNNLYRFIYILYMVMYVLRHTYRKRSEYSNCTYKWVGSVSFTMPCKCIAKLLPSAFWRFVLVTTTRRQSSQICQYELRWIWALCALVSSIKRTWRFAFRPSFNGRHKSPTVVYRRKHIYTYTRHKPPNRWVRHVSRANLSCGLFYLTN